MGWAGSKGVENSCVILFLNLGKFRYIWDCSFVQPLYLATFVSRDTFLLRRGLGEVFQTTTPAYHLVMRRYAGVAVLYVCKGKMPLRKAGRRHCRHRRLRERVGTEPVRLRQGHRTEHHRPWAEALWHRLGQLPDRCAVHSMHECC